MSLVEIQKSLPTTTKILAVSKLQSEDQIRALYEKGQRSFGENYVQELTKKMENLANLDIHWHFIGSLQKNKAKYIVGKVDLIHSVDSFELAQALQKEAVKKNVIQNILIQVNIAEEQTKSGIKLSEVKELVEKIKALPNIKIKGLMTMPPLELDPEQARPYFRELRKLRDQLTSLSPELTELSMGTSHDYSVAAEEGATWVRLGTILFGERPRRLS
ncbi:MAG: UPF0001 protein [Oligoflexia bacterium]|nr:MAG: UPF0001 protein [Oligoflexia bacterium]